MPKEIPVCPGPPKQRGLEKAHRDYRISLLTPMFGGGVDTGCPDALFPIRPTAIRGQLQFWWRATIGSAYHDHKSLFDAHAAVWGKTETASPVEVEVRDVAVDSPRDCAHYEYQPPRNERPARFDLVWHEPFSIQLRKPWGTVSEPKQVVYALFPFQGKKPKRAMPGSSPEKSPAQYIPSGKFVLRLKFPKSIRRDVETAVWAWINFGGLGARTRRGCGSLFCAEIAPKSVDTLSTWFKSPAEPSADNILEWSTVPRSFLYHPVPGPALAIWNDVVGFLRYFRQHQGFARNLGRQPNRPGRSRYPEPETIRQIPNSGADRQVSGHQRLSYIPADAFPRAEFGLPIVFHFQGRGEPPGDPSGDDFTLYPEADAKGEPRDRMSSPLIIKPLALVDGTAVAVIMRLSAPQLTGVELRSGPTVVPLPPTTTVRGSRLASYRPPDGSWCSPLSGSKVGSALEAFLALACDTENGFLEATR